MTIQANFPNVQPSLLLDFANAKQLPPSVTFTRATTATYYDGHTTALAEQNLLLYSGTVGGTSWLAFNSPTISTNNATAPDGTSTATLVTTASTTKQSIYQTTASISNSGYTMSVYAKAGTNSWIALDDGIGNTSAWFNVSAGTVGTVASGFTSSITSVGSGWYRCSITKTSSGTLTTLIGVSFPNGDNVQTQTIGNTVYLWGAQLELRTSLTAYTATTTQAITNYIPVLLTAGGGQPRFDHNPTTSESLGLLIEEQRTNICLYSEQFNSAGWSGPVTEVNQAIISPAGTLTGCALQEAASLQYQRTQQVIGVSAGATYTTTVYAKKGLRNWLTIDSGPTAYYNLDTGTVGSVGAGATTSMTAVGDGWYRCSYTYTNPTTSLAVYIGTSATGSDGGLYTGTGYDAIYVWGAQVEAGAFATSYIPTTSASATRAADTAVMTGNNFSSWFNNSEGTLYVEASPQTLSTNSMGMASLTNTAGSSNSIAMYYTGGSLVDVESLVNSVAQYTYLISRGSPPTKVAHGYKVNNSNVALNGTAYTPDTVCLVPPVNTLTIGTIYDAVSFPCNGTVRKFAYYPIRVTDAQLAALTS